MHVVRRQYKTNLLLLQMGRVGSKSIRQALQGAGLTTLHVHYLYDPIEPKHGHQDDLRYVQDHLIEPVKIISVVRDPLARAVSAWANTQARDKSLLEIDPKEVSTWVEDTMAWRWPLLWWYEQLNRFTGIDCVEAMHKLDVGTHKHMLFYTPRGLLLLLRNENLHESNRWLSSFVEKDVVIPTINQTVPHAREIYQDFVSKVKFNPELVHLVYHGKAVQYCYTDEEIDEFKERWTA